MFAAAPQKQNQKLEAQIMALSKFTFTICPWSYSESNLNAKTGKALQTELIERLKSCGLQPMVDFFYSDPNSIDMIRFERRACLLEQYNVSFNNTGTVLKALKVLPVHFALRSQGAINLEELRITYMLQHNDSECVTPADLADIIELHQRSYRELLAKVEVAIQTSAGNNHPALVNFQAAKKYIDESVKDHPYLVEESRYTLLMMALWYVVQELAEVKPEEVKEGFMSVFRKKKAEASPLNAEYKKLLDEYIKRMPTRLTDSSVTTSEAVKALYREKIGRHIKAVLPAPGKK